MRGRITLAEADEALLNQDAADRVGFVCADDFQFYDHGPLVELIDGRLVL